MHLMAECERPARVSLVLRIRIGMASRKTYAHTSSESWPVGDGNDASGLCCVRLAGSGEGGEGGEGWEGC